MRKAIVRDSDGAVLNVIEHDASSDASGWMPPKGSALVSADDDCEPGGTWTKNGGFVRAPDPVSPAPDPLIEAAKRTQAIESVLIERGVITKEQIDVKAQVVALAAAAEIR